MSHFTVLVIGDNPEEQLAPFDESIVVPAYYKKAVSEEDKESMVEYYTKEHNFVYSNNFDELYKKHGDSWNGGRWRKHIDGTWHEYSTYNPQSKWDWYSLGGRWSGQVLKLKKGAPGVNGEPGVFNNSVGVDQALSQHIENLQEIKTFAYLKDGEWLERAETGWYGPGEKSLADEEYEERIKNLLSSIPDGTLVSVYDCHI